MDCQSFSFKGDNLHGMSKSVFSKKNKKTIPKCCLLKFLPGPLSAKDVVVTIVTLH